MKNIVLILIFGFLLLKCKPQKEQSMTAKHVYTHDCNPEPEIICPRYDFYYVYYYKPKDSILLYKMTDTLSIDTTNGQHYYFFYSYNSNMPDTTELKNKMKDWYNYKLKESPGLDKHSPNLLMIFGFNESYFSKGRQFPDNFNISTKGEDGYLKEKYFLRDRTTNKLKEVPVDFVRPVNL